MMPQLSAKELAIIVGLADGMQSKEIAVSVRLSKASIDTYVRILFGKLGARSRAQLVALSYAAGILQSGDVAARPQISSGAASSAGLTFDASAAIV